jgi:hypothetical protein
MNPLRADFAGEPRHLLVTPLVEPDDGRPYWNALRSERHEGLPLIRDRYGGNALGSDFLK